ncbi:MAG TPA: prepilin peptidase [Candidatus Korarchaeota archaeon]|nr:prepilin peptidase [Candidatus Korarchaeota archaeon]
MLLLIATLEAFLSMLLDLKTHRIPNKWILSLLALNSLISSLQGPAFRVFIRILSSTSLSLALYRVGFGGGDCKLIIAISPLLSTQDLCSMLILSFLLALARGRGYFHSLYLFFSLMIIFIKKSVGGLNHLILAVISKESPCDMPIITRQSKIHHLMYFSSPLRSSTFRIQRTNQRIKRIGSKALNVLLMAFRYTFISRRRFFSNFSRRPHMSLTNRS